jgi:transposase
MGCATTSGIRSRIFCLVEKAMWEALPRTIGCLSKPCSTDLDTNPGAVIADKAYDADALIDKRTEQGVTPVILPKDNRKDKRECALYCERNLIERFFNKIKHFRAIATRYDKLARNYLAAVQLVAAMILLN